MLLQSTGCSKCTACLHPSEGGRGGEIGQEEATAGKRLAGFWGCEKRREGGDGEGVWDEAGHEGRRGGKGEHDG
eukprot:750467-Hanusia_phi.AAC.5